MVTTLERSSLIPAKEDLQYADDLTMPSDFPVRKGLTYKAKKEADFLYSIARGIMLITGSPGSGKDLFGISLCALNKYYFRDIFNTSKPRKILLDFLPKRAFGEYVPFTPETMLNEIKRMAKASKMDGFEKSNDEKESDFIGEATQNWALEGEGEILLRGGILYLSELRRYCYNRDSMKAINKYIGSLCTIYRHLDLLILGTHVKANEIDRKNFLEHTTHWVKCSWQGYNTTKAKIERTVFVDGNQVLEGLGKPKYLRVNGKKPREYLNGHCYYDLYDTKCMVNLRPVMPTKGR